MNVASSPAATAVIGSAESERSTPTEIAPPDDRDELAAAATDDIAQDDRSAPARSAASMFSGPPVRRWWLPALLVVAVAAAGYALFLYWPAGHAHNEPVASIPNVRNTQRPDTREGSIRASSMTAKDGAAISGIYVAHVGDQDIALTLNADRPRPPEATSGVAHYYNRAVRRDCAAMIVPISGDVNGQGQAFNQTRIAGMAACDRNIRLRLALADKGAGLSVIWTDPITGAELMRATLTR